MAEVPFVAPAPPARARLLVVEDDQHIRTFCQRLLQRTYDVEVAEHGQAALDLLQQYAFDLVLTDLQMPHMGGLELLTHIRRDFPHVDTLVLTAHATVDTAREALKLGALDYLDKPVETENLHRTVRTCLELRRTRQEKERLSDLVFMYQFSQAIASSLAIETQVQQIITFLWQRYTPAAVSLSMVEGSQLCLLLARSATGRSPAAQRINLPAQMSTSDLQQAHWSLVGCDAEEAHNPRQLGVELRSHDQVVGYLHLARHPEQPVFDGAERQLLAIFAGQVAASLDNARLHRALKEQHRQTIAALSEAIDARDNYTYGHSRQVTRYAVRLAQIIGLAPERIELLDYAGLLHDVGKIGIRDHILLKPGALDDEEFAMMARHPQIGVKIIAQVGGLRATLPIIAAHHERWDGKGYPHGMAGEAIPLEARILAIADAYEAMTANRAYRPAMRTEEALGILIRGRGTQWDPQLIDQFVALIRREGEALRIDEMPSQLPSPLLSASVTMAG